MPLQGAWRAERLSLLSVGCRVRAGSPAPPSPTSSMGNFGPSRSKRVLRSPPALTLLRTPWAGNARGKRAVAFLPPPLPRQQCSRRRTLRRLERRACVVGGPAGSPREVGGGAAGAGRLEGAFLTSTPPALPWKLPGQPHLCWLLQAPPPYKQQLPEPSSAPAPSSRNSNPAPATLASHKQEMRGQTSTIPPGCLCHAFLYSASHPEFSKSQCFPL